MVNIDEHKSICISCGNTGWKKSAPSGKYIYKEGYCERCGNIYFKVKKLIEADEKISKNKEYLNLILNRVSMRINSNDPHLSNLYDEDINELREALYDYMCVRRKLLGVVEYTNK